MHPYRLTIYNRHQDPIDEFECADETAVVRTLLRRYKSLSDYLNDQEETWDVSDQTETSVPYEMTQNVTRRLRAQLELEDAERRKAA